MDEQQCGEPLDSLRELSAFELGIQTAQSKAEVSEILHRHGLSEAMLVHRFPDLAKKALELPDEAST